MTDFFREAFGNGMLSTYGEAILSTLKVTLIGTLAAYIIGLPIGIILYGTSQNGIFPNKTINIIMGIIVNILRSVPFVILLVLTQPIAKLITGTRLGDYAFTVSLVIAAAPFVARMVESSLKEVNRGVIEAAQSMGSSNSQIIFKVLIPEAKPSLIVGSAIAITTILGYTPMTYLIAGGGLGMLAIQYGLYRFNDAIKYMASILLIIVVQIMQEVLSRIALASDKRK